ncbi:MAG TPA: LamG domain-containing protein [Verrucomicrobiae bacterium]|nr:LamG domain-containing protein [Verrucomicrobiae bacterium]
MKTATRAISTHLSSFGLLILAACVWFAPSARAGLTVDVHLYHDTIGYYFYPWLNANTNAPDFPNGNYMIASPQIPTNGSQLQYQATNNTLSYATGGGNYYYDFNSFLYGITNGYWSILVTNSTSTNLYLFTVHVTGLTSNAFGAPTVVTFPPNNQQYVSDLPLFTWTGPTDWVGAVQVWDYLIDTNGNYNYVDSAALAPGATSWTPSVFLPNGTNTFTADYDSNLTATVVASIPTNTAGGQAISGWISTAQMETSQGIQFTVGQPANDYDPFLVARYNFEDTNDPYADSSGNNNYNDCSTSSGTNYDTFSTNAAVGQFARLFFGDTSVCFTQNDPAYQNLSNAFAGNFSVTAWVKTTNSINTDFANAYFGLPIWFVYSDGTDQAVFSITGSKAAFTVGNPNGGSDTTLHSITSVNDGNYHFLAATRNQTTGLMSLYVDGNLEATGISTNGPRIMTSTMSLAGGYYVSYGGLLDDVRIYSTNLSASDVAILASGGSVITLASGVGATNLMFATSGDANWFVENTNTYNGSPFADQSGSISNFQSSTLTATVTGPGTLTFYWSSQDNDPEQYMDYEFYIDDPNTNDIADLYGGGNDWQSIEAITGGPVIIPPGQHTLYWTVYANGDADPFQAGFLDNVVFTPPDTSPVSASITFNIYQEQDPTFGDIYIAFPSFNSVTPAGTGTTTNIIQSPNNYFSSHSDQGGGGSSSAILYSLSSVLNESTNGLWSLYINYGMQNQRQFQFSVAINGLATNLLSAVKMITPTNGATGFPSTAAIQWLGPTNYTSLNVSKQNIDNSGYVSATLPVTATSWTPGLIPGTNRCDINYASNNFPNVSFSVPVDSLDSQTAAVWNAQVNLNTTATAIFVVTAGASHVTLLSPQVSSGNFQFSFQSQTGFTNTVQYRTNLVVGNWLTWTNITGDGTLKTNPIPLSVFSPSKQGFIRVSTQ